ncbi:alkylhydroperoxidase/carboxymuconolactone decarboxylase family protein YurZ [Planomicrobium stackebrandtii]|uniref:Alkylhydroperoxidase/carboxymuconolactone decarboxylase family protein YurZ n=1 Tax=Planomicrobium stackebrandtii TaxID=253160 RepID=A0ABU0GXR5_9BACL|nr:carboxymuconolactone decarboxylase family protein [Planomicrobium stackebrandtii]MDQ0429340.1 alkylhydroperoxidase/carboxymuconolactone decarboxylase family protein YurZ [Planomicrobium stackebrandtii]
MSKALDYFKEVYDVVPGWVQKMHDYSPAVLDTYTGIRGEIMQDSALSRKEKDALIASMNAARLYSRSMLFHTKGAIDFGYTVPELAEFFLTSYLYKGDQAMALALEAISYALELKGKTVAQPAQSPERAADSLKIIIDWLDGEDTSYLKETLALIRSGKPEDVKAKILEDGLISSRLKHLNMAGNFIVELNGKDAAPWMEKARTAGASEADLADIGYICILTAGIPAWFELSDSLKTTE